MKSVKLVLFTMIVCGITSQLVAQRQDRRPGGPPRDGEDSRRGGGHPDGFRPPPNPILDALDADGDHELSSDEIANAVAALKSLDKDEDGSLSREELRPNRPDGRRPGGPDGEFGGRRPGGRGGEFGMRRRPGREGEQGRDGERSRGGPGGPPEGRRGGPNAEGGGPGGDFDADKFVERLMKFDENEDGQISTDELPSACNAWSIAPTTTRTVCFLSRNSSRWQNKLATRGARSAVVAKGVEKIVLSAQPWTRNPTWAAEAELSCLTLTPHRIVLIRRRFAPPCRFVHRCRKSLG